MSKVSALFSVGKQSLMNSQTALQTTGHNVANKTTEGYTRQRVEIQSNAPIGRGKLQIGTGAQAKEVTRVINPFLEKQITAAKATSGQINAQSEIFERLEQVYNEQANKGLNQYMSDFFNSWRELSNTPESLSTRSLVRDAADFLAKDFTRVHQQLRASQREADVEISGTVEKINAITREIADLNHKVTQIEIQGVTANDNRDRRDLLLKNLSDLVDVSVAENEVGQVTVRAGGAVLVSGLTQMTLEAVRTGEREGVVDIYYRYSATATPTKVNHMIKGGRLGGLLKMRDEVVENFISKNNQMALAFAKEVNLAHRQGLDRNGQPAGDFFSIDPSAESPAQTIKVRKEILNNVGKIASGFKNAPGDNTVAHVISSLQYKKTMGDGDASFDDYYSSIVGEVGLAADKANKSRESSQNILTQLTKMRESISGVNLDEEMTQMIEHQKTYQASAHLIKTVDEMLQTILDLKR